MTVLDLVVVVVITLLAVLLATGLYVLASVRSTSREEVLRASRRPRPPRHSGEGGATTQGSVGEAE